MNWTIYMYTCIKYYMTVQCIYTAEYFKQLCRLEKHKANCTSQVFMKITRGNRPCNFDILKF